MALTTTQVNQAFLGLLGRPAEGSAVAWGANSLSVAALANSVVDIRKGADFTNSKEAFVENLYSQLLGRPSDAEGKEFWLEALNNGVSYGDVLSQFVNAVLAQPSSADIYTLQNKLSIAEQISTQVNTFQGSAAAEATLKDLMNTVNANTTYANVEDSVNEFIGQNVNIANVTVKQGAEEATEGSDEHATVFNATLDLSKDGEISISDNSSFADTLNLSVKGVKDEQENLSTIGSVDGIKTLNITTTNIVSSNLNSSSVGGAKSVTFKGSSKDEFTADSAMTLLDTGAGDDKITLNAKVSTVKAGAGDDIITIGSSAKDVAMSIDGGAGTNTIVLGGANATDSFTKVSFSNIKVLAGKGAVAKSSLDNKTITIGGNDANATYASGDLTVKAADGINLSKVTALEGKTDSKIAINGVKSGKVSLNKEDGITETTTLVDTAKGVVVSGNASGDKVIFDWSANLTTVNDAKTNGIAANKIAQVTETLNGLSDIQKLVANEKSFAANSFIVGGDIDAGYKLYQVTSEIARDNQGALTKAGAVKLIGTIQGDGSAAATLSIDSNNNALLTFA